MRKSRIAVTFAAVLLSVAGCTSSNTTTAPGSPAAVTSATPDSAPTGSDATPTPAGGVTGKHINVCDVLAVSAVASATGRPYAKAEPKTFTNPAPGSACNYAGANDGALLGLDVTVTYSQPDTIYKTWQSTSSSLGYTMSAVSGLGDKAFSDTDDLVVMYGSDVVAIQDALAPPGTKPLSLDTMKQLMNVVHAAL
jgi:hypothetical protein